MSLRLFHDAVLDKHIMKLFLAHILISFLCDIIIFSSSNASIRIGMRDTQ